ncbi:MAG: LytR C-terminal domain-containing protein [Propionibacteriaceae bacterium]|jgi:hypothetical protein|nr:LytR C-terminal domain-containing protein [Propionibacteriaceae bacterium]
MDAKHVGRLISTPLTLLILVGLLVAGAIWGYKAVTAAVPVAPPPSCVPQPMTDLATSAVTVNVLNGGDIRGLANSVSEQLKAGGFMVATVGNTEERVLGTVIVGAVADDPEVQLVAAWFTNPEIRADGRPNHTVDVLLGNEYDTTAGMNPTPPASIQVPSGEVCLPGSTASATPTPTAG